MPKKTIVIGISDVKVSDNPEDVLATYSLGSCVGVCLYDPLNHIGSMLHYQLPSSKMDIDRAMEKPLMFADSGFELMMKKMLTMGAEKKKMEVKIAGGAIMDIGPKGFDIGKRNLLAIRQILWKNRMFIHANDVGGTAPRNMYLDISNGEVKIKTKGEEKKI